MSCQIIIGVAFVLVAGFLGVALAFWVNSRFPDEDPRNRFPD